MAGAERMKNAILVQEKIKKSVQRVKGKERGRETDNLPL